MDAHFSSTRLSLDRGFVYALRIRGGRRFGRKWYEDGKLLKRKILSQILLIVLNIVKQKNIPLRTFIC
jgi:prolyl oligopeptidase PreP (S9A serine peptidase family)